MDKTWRDQPDECEDATMLLAFKTAARRIEVRQAQSGAFLLTQGNAYGSETLTTTSAPDAFLALNMLLGLSEQSASSARLPLNVTVLPNAAPGEHATRTAEEI